MLVYRISKAKRAKDLTGEGAKRYGGRWNSKDRRMLYTSENKSLCVCETLVHFSKYTVPKDMACITLEIPAASISSDHEKYVFGSKKTTVALGDLWLDGRKTLALRVPSVVVAGEFNVLLNPEHPDMEKVRIVSIDPFVYDNRLLNQ